MSHIILTEEVNKSEKLHYESLTAISLTKHPLLPGQTIVVSLTAVPSAVVNRDRFDLFPSSFWQIHALAGFFGLRHVFATARDMAKGGLLLHVGNIEVEEDTLATESHRFQVTCVW